MNLQGFRCRVVIAGVPFVVATFGFRDECESIDVSNSEGVSGEDDLSDEPVPIEDGHRHLQKMGGRSGAVLSLKQATLLTNKNGNPFTHPFSLRSRQVVEVWILPDRHVRLRHRIPRLLINRISHEGEVQALQPIDIEGESDSTFSIYEAF